MVLFVAEPDEDLLDEADKALLTLLAEGHAARRVSRSLSISDSTLRRRLAEIQRRLGGNSRINTIYIAAKRGLI